MIAFLAHFLVVLAAWTLVIKFVFPVAYALWEGAAPGTYVYWDLWWAVHLWLAWSLLHWRRYTYALAVAVAAAEVVIVVTKLTLFLADPSWSIWRTNWFINKLFVLACFSIMLVYFLAHRRRLLQRREHDTADTRGRPAA